MKLKASLHLHSGEDIREGELIGYSIYELIDEAKALDFQALALTCHLASVAKPEHIAYAKGRGILLIPGVELELEEAGRLGHVLVLNSNSETDRLTKFSDLPEYRRRHPECLIVAAHPNFGFGASMGLKLLKKYLACFDAVEHSWFYSVGFNLNKATERIAATGKKKMLAASDCHHFNRETLGTDYCWIDADQQTSEAIIKALRQGKWQNVTKPKTWPYLIKSFFGLLLTAWNLKLIKKNQLSETT